MPNVLATLCLCCCCTFFVAAGKNATEYAEKLRKNAKEAIAADMLLGQINPLWTGYASMNSEVQSAQPQLSHPASSNPSLSNAERPVPLMLPDVWTDSRTFRSQLPQPATPKWSWEPESLCKAILRRCGLHHWGWLPNRDPQAKQGGLQRVLVSWNPDRWKVCNNPQPIVPSLPYPCNFCQLCPTLGDSICFPLLSTTIVVLLLQLHD